MPLYQRPSFLKNNEGLTTHSLIESTGAAVMVTNSGPPGSVAWPVANTALFYPFVISEDRVLEGVSVIQGTVTGNIDYGIFDENLNRLWSSGTVTMSGNANISTGSLRVPRGVIYVALAHSSTTASLSGYGGSSWMSMLGIFAMSAALPLPAVAVPERLTSATWRLFTVALRFRTPL